MLIHISRELLVKAIQHVYKAVSNNGRGSMISVINILVQNEWIFISGTGTSLAVQYKVCTSDSKVRIFNQGSITCQANYLYEISRKLVDDIVIIEVIEQRILYITSGSTQVRLNGMLHTDIPFFSQNKYQQTTNQFIVPCNLLVPMIKQVAGVASTTDAKPVFMGVCLEIQGSQLTMIATDGVVRMARCSIPIENDAGWTGISIIPATSLIDIAKMLTNDGFTDVVIELNHYEIRFMTPNLLIKSAVIEGLYPSTRNLVPHIHVSEVVLDNISFRQLLDRVSVLAGYHLVTMQISEGRLTLLSNTAEIGGISDELDLKEQSGENFSITINGKFLISTLRCVNEDYIRIRFTGSRSPILLLPVREERDWLFLLTPVLTKSS
ncbi:MULTISPECIES: DNA polymerase III subunit beta [Paenibacillus]|uniref:Beta sliding clamp n=1 Tax=Paenibacillus lactis TaxID=228574 RepID=A0ABS4FCT9_9BACL|nr:DNA polymerase III subunit beta [Paenibacillus lactis]MBP1894073.1 DNA polymerase-3 subunit beta [Paenibacillus lactis]